MGTGIYINHCCSYSDSTYNGPLYVQQFYIYIQHRPTHQETGPRPPIRARAVYRTTLYTTSAPTTPNKKPGTTPQSEPIQYTIQKCVGVGGIQTMCKCGGRGGSGRRRKEGGKRLHPGEACRCYLSIGNSSHHDFRCCAGGGGGLAAGGP